MTYSGVHYYILTYPNKTLAHISLSWNKLLTQISSIVYCKSSFIIYLPECYICKIVYIGKSEIPVFIRPNNHRKDIKNYSTISACKHFNKHDHGINNHRKLIVIVQLRNITTTSTDVLKERVKQQRNFWIIKLGTLVPHGLKQELKPYYAEFPFSNIIYQ